MIYLDDDVAYNHRHQIKIDFFSTPIGLYCFPMFCADNYKTMDENIVIIFIVIFVVMENEKPNRSSSLSGDRKLQEYNGREYIFFQQI